MKTMIKRHRVATALIIGSVAIGLCGAISYRWNFPHGNTHHACISNLGKALQAYAETNGGYFPAGGRCPEASLSLLHYSTDPGAENLGGKAVPPGVAQIVLGADGFLSPDSCDWHYVEGLTRSDDIRIALLWDKLGLGHQGNRLSRGGHEVLFINGDARDIEGSDWPQFLREQEELRAGRKTK